MEGILYPASEPWGFPQPLWLSPLPVAEHGPTLMLVLHYLGFRV